MEVRWKCYLIICSDSKTKSKFITGASYGTVVCGERSLILNTFSITTIFNIGGGEAKKINFELPTNAQIVPNVAGLLGGIRLFEDI